MRAAHIDPTQGAWRNLMRNPTCSVNPLNAEGSGTGTRTRVNDVIRRPGTWATRLVVTAGGVGLSLTQGVVPVKPSTKYTVGWWTYVEAGPVTAWVASDTSYGNAQSIGAPADTSGAYWQRKVSTFTTKTTQTTLRIYNTVQAPAQFLVTDVILAEGDRVPDVVDPDMPGWRWTGTAGDSESVGYEQGLGGIVGARAYEGEDLPASTSSLATITTGGSCTVLAVQSAANAADGMWAINQTSPGQWRRVLNGAAGGLYLRADALKNDATWNIVNTPNYASATTNLHGHAARCSGGGQEGALDTGAAFSNLPADPRPWDGSAFTFRVGYRDGIAFPAVVTKYAGVTTRFLDGETMRRALGWLARKYGTPVPAGY